MAVNHNGYMGFSIDLKPWICYDKENIIKVDVDNSQQPNSRWYTGSGIYRDVNLWTGLGVYIPIENPEKWSPDHPALYECRIETKIDDEICDVITSEFGIRVLSLDPVQRFQINGETVNLRGTCIHHDNGVIGAETFPEAEWYRCKRLKEAGFNAIRSAYHPMSRAMLDACDHLGMLVMDELTDMWNRGKNTYDFSDIFEEEAAQWIRHMVEKDYNHPSVIIYSVGNEIQEAGTKQGSWINRFLCNTFHELDSTRYTTNALNGLNCAGKRLGVIMKDVAEQYGSASSVDGGWMRSDG